MSTFVRVPVYFSDRRKDRGLGTEHGTQGDAQPHHPAPDHVRRRAHNRHRLQGAREADTAAIRRRKRGRQVPVAGEHVSGCTFRDLFMYMAPWRPSALGLHVCLAPQVRRTRVELGDEQVLVGVERILQFE